jgi:hypothetical protein
MCNLFERKLKKQIAMKKLVLNTLFTAAATSALAAFSVFSVAPAMAQNGPLDGSQFDSRNVGFDKIDSTGPHWYREGLGGITLSQVSLNHWAAGGEGSLAYDAMLNYDAIYTNRRHLWQNRLELAYGMSTTDSRGTRKTNDKIYLNSTYGYRISRTWYASVMGIFSTQFARGYNYNTSPRTYLSRFMSPGYFGLGVGFTWRPNTWFNAYLSPATWRGTVVTDKKLFQNAAGEMVYSPYGVTPGRKLYNEFGANVRLELNRELWRNVDLYSRLDMFSNYLYKPQNIDVRWYVLLTARINKWLAANLSLNMLYDDHIRFMRQDGTIGGSRLQVKEVLGIGLQTSF